MGGTKKMTLLESIQKKIDNCNDKGGCDSKCNKKEQELCGLLRLRSHRMNYCREKKLPIEKW